MSDPGPDFKRLLMDGQRLKFAFRAASEKLRISGHYETADELKAAYDQLRALVEMIGAKVLQ